MARAVRPVLDRTRDTTDALSFTLGDWERMLLGDLVEAEVRIKVIEKEMLERLKPHSKALEVLKAMPGVDAVAAASIMAETGPDMAVFGSVHSFTDWAGLSPGKRRYGATRKGSKYLRATLVEAAHAASRTGNCQFPGYKRNVGARRGSKRAIVATAHSLSCCVTAYPTGTPAPTTRPWWSTAMPRAGCASSAGSGFSNRMATEASASTGTP